MYFPQFNVITVLKYSPFLNRQKNEEYKRIWDICQDKDIHAWDQILLYILYGCWKLKLVHFML